MVEVLRALDGMHGHILPTSARKISEVRHIARCTVHCTKLQASCDAFWPQRLLQIVQMCWNHRCLPNSANVLEHTSTAVPDAV